MKNAIASFFSGALCSMGLGGGGILILYLILFLKEEQITAQGINLLFFIPCAAISTIIYSFKKLIKLKSVMFTFLGGFPGVLLGSYLLSIINPIWISRIFGIFLLISGIKALFIKEKL